MTLFPQPDSPTIPSVSPGAMSKETPSTAWIVPRRVQNWTRRSSTERSDSSPVAEFGIQSLAQTVADQVEAETREDDRGAGNQR